MKKILWFTGFLLILLSQISQAENNCRTLVVVGMKDERTIAMGSDDDLEVVVGAANANVLKEKLRGLDARQFRAVFSFGVAGGLDPALKTGELLFSEQVLSHIEVEGKTADVNWPVDARLLLAASYHANKVQLPFRKGIFFGTPIEARDQPENAETSLREMTGADLIDNETHLAAQYASENGLPFLSIRAVSDLVAESLPPAALLPLDAEDGSPDGFAIAKSLLKNPLQIPALIRTAYHYQQALDTLERFRREIGFSKLVAGGALECQ